MTPRSIDRSHNPKPLVLTNDQVELVIQALVVYRSDYATTREPQSLPDIEEIIRELRRL